ncbi:cathepsin B-like protein [Acrasis kona]|uniref:Cathepsin B-like protein n=1 Tax=Acrasis kona TaxID=1008807 RepID=A0AAW2ZCC3_9EUKA
MKLSIVAVVLIASFVVGINRFTVPESYDFRTNHPDWVPPIRNQGLCGSCWAFSTSYVYSTRLYLSAKQQGAPNVYKQIFSPQHQINCHRSQYLNGCSGGVIQDAFESIQEFGTTTDTCVPYKSSKDYFDVRRHKCTVTTCKRSTDPVKMYYGSRTIRVEVDDNNTAEDIAYLMKRQILTQGPVSTSFRIGIDFLTFFKKNPKGIYKGSSTKGRLGSHAIVTLGWGVENGVEYWICANSWGTSWGNQVTTLGYFKFKVLAPNGIEKGGFTAISFDKPDSYIKPSPIAREDGSSKKKTTSGVVKIDSTSEEAKLAAAFAFESVKSKVPKVTSYTIQEIHSQPVEGFNFFVLLNVDARESKYNLFVSIHYSPDLVPTMTNFKFMAPSASQTCKSAVGTPLVGAARCMVEVVNK